ncbi:protein stum [Armigeres subalbatus]|uniref:protein stum n=1 Tax=Armigeres subalbatus TaxID=124917 RepID=UPI002ED4C9A9
MSMNMFGRNDDHSNATASAGPSRSRFDYYYNTTSSPSSSVENQRSTDDTQTSLFGDPVLPATRHSDLLEGGDLYQSLKNNIELYHSKLYNEQEKQRQAERDRLFNEYTAQRGSSSATTSSSGAKASLGNTTVTNYGVDPSRRFQRTRSANLGLDAIGNRPILQDMDLLKHNDWINFSEYEYNDSLIPKTSQAVVDVQQFTNNNLNRTIENGVFQNPRAAALKARRNSMSDNLYAPSTFSGYEVVDKLKPSTFTILGHGMMEPRSYDGSAIYLGGSDVTNSADAMSVYERMLRYHKLDATKPILTDKITTGSNFRVPEGRQHKKPSFTIINESLPKSNSFDTSSGLFLPYSAKQQMVGPRIMSASSVGNSAFLNSRGHQLNLTSDDPFLSYQRRFSTTSQVSPKSLGKRRKSVSKKSAGAGKKSKSKTATINVPNPNRKQRGVLGILNRETPSPTKQPNNDKSAKLAVTGVYDDGQSSTTMTETTDTIDIPEHQLRNLKMFYRPFSVRPTLSPVPDKSSMENSQIDLEKESSPTKEKASYLRTPVFNIRGLLSPGRLKGKSVSPTRAEKGGLASVGAAMGAAIAAVAVGDAKREDSKERPEPPKRRGFNLAKAIIDYGKKSDQEEEKKAKEEPAQPKPDVKRDGRRKDSEGNRVKDKKDSPKKKTPKKKSVPTKTKSKKGGAKDDYDDYYEEDEKPKRGMLRGALNLASSLRGGSKKGTTKEPTKVSRVVSAKKGGEKSAKPGTGSRTAGGVKSGKASERISQRAAEKSAKAGAKTTPKSASGPKGKQLRRSSSTSALNVDSIKKMNRLYEKNAKAGDRNGKMLKGDKKTRQSTENLLKKADSRGELKQKTGAKSATEKVIEKRDSEKSLKKSDSSKSILKLGKKSDSKGSLHGKRSESKTSLHQIEAMASKVGSSSAAAADTPGSGGGHKSDVESTKNTHDSTNEAPTDSGKRSTKPTPTLSKKLHSKGSLLSLLSMKSATRKPQDADDSGGRDSRPGTGMGRLKSASVKNMSAKPGTPTGADGEFGSDGSIKEKPGSTKPQRRGMLSKNNSSISMKSIVHARSFINIRPSSNGSEMKKIDSMPQMGKVQEGSQEHEETDHGLSMKGAIGAVTTASATHTMRVAGVGEGEKVSNEYNEQRAKGQSPDADPKGGSSNVKGNEPSANTDSMMMQRHQGEEENSDEFNETGKSKCCTCCGPCWTKTCLPFKRCFSCSSCCGRCRGKDHAKPKPKAKPKAAGGGSFWKRLNCCRSCRRSKTSPAEAQPPAATPKKSCWQSLSCCAGCRRNKSRELVPRSSIDSEPEEKPSRCRSCWSRLLCCSRFRKGNKVVQRHKMQSEPAEMETVKCCFCCKRTRPIKQEKPKKPKPKVKSSFNCLSCCMMCCPKKDANGSRRTSNFSKKQSIAPTIPPEDLRPKIDMSLVEHSSMMRGAIPVLPICLAYFCLVLNVVIPGSGTILSGGLCLCIGKPRFSQHDSIKGRIGSFIINCIVGVSQCFTIIFCVVGWGWAIWWGTIMVRLAKQHQQILEMEAAQQEGEEQTTLSQQTGGSNPPVALVSQNHRRDVETGR